KRFGIEGVEGQHAGDSSGAADGAIAATIGAQNLPRAAKKETAVVWKLHPDNTMEPVKVSLGITDHAYTEVSSVLRGELKEAECAIIPPVAAIMQVLGGIRR